MGRLADRFGVMRAAADRRASGLGAGFIAAGMAGSIVAFALAHGLLHRPARQLGDLRAAGRRHLALVRAAPRHRGGDLRQRQLPRRRDLAADRAALRRDRRLAPDLHRPRRLLRRRRCRCWRCCMRRRPPRWRRAGAGAPHCGTPSQRPFGLSPRHARRRCCASPASPAASRCRCRRCTSSPTAATSATAPRAARRCCR